MGFDFLSFQLKKRAHIIIPLAISAALISTHYFLLGRIVAGIIVAISVVRFITCYFTTNKKFIYVFILINTIILFLTYNSPYDLIVYAGIAVVIVASFQEDTKWLRRLMMVGTSTLIIYNAIIFSPMGVVVEGSFLISNLVGYYRHHIRKGMLLKT